MWDLVVQIVELQNWWSDDMLVVLLQGVFLVFVVVGVVFLFWGVDLWLCYVVWIFVLFCFVFFFDLESFVGFVRYLVFFLMVVEQSYYFSGEYLIGWVFEVIVFDGGGVLIVSDFELFGCCFVDFEFGVNGLFKVLFWFWFFGFFCMFLSVF